MQRITKFSVRAAVGLCISLGFIACFVEFHEKQFCVGGTTGQIRTDNKWMWIIQSTEIEEGVLSEAIAATFGTQPAEENWIWIGVLSKGLLTSWSGTDYTLEVTLDVSDRIGALVLHDQSSWSGQIPFHGFTQQAKEKVLQEFLVALQLKYNNEIAPARIYWNRLITIISVLDHPALVEDIPTAEEALNDEIWNEKWVPRLENEKGC